MRFFLKDDPKGIKYWQEKREEDFMQNPLKRVNCTLFLFRLEG